MRSSMQSLLNNLAEEPDEDDWEEEYTKTGYRYPDREVAWLEFYRVERHGDRWAAVCLEDGEVFRRYGKKHAMDAVEIHIMRGHRSPDVEKKPTPKECPF